MSDTRKLLGALAQQLFEGLAIGWILGCALVILAAWWGSR